MADQQMKQSKSSCVVESTAHLSDNEVEIEGGSEQSRLLYTVRESPPVHLTVVFALQMALMNVSFCITMALIISGVFCGDDALTAKLTSSTLLLSGIATVVQTVLGLRLPVFQGPNPTFLVPLLNMAVYPEWACPQTSNHTQELQTNVTISTPSGTSVLSSHERIQMAEGSLVLASLIHVLLGGSGLMGRVMTFIGPLTIAPTIAMIGISLFKPALDLCETSWPVAALTFGVFLAMTAYFGHLWLPVPAWSRKNGCYITRYPYLQIFAILAAFICGWLLSHVLTVTGAITDDPSRVEFQARSDAKLHTIRDADWFYFSYPGQFGRPSWSAPLVTGMVVCVLLSIVESLGDYVAVSQVCGEPYPPRHALNRGVMVEGLTSVVSGLYGVGHGTTSYSEMTSVIGLTKVASRRVFIVSGLIMVVMGVFGKLGAVLVCIPPPVLGGKMVLALGTLVGMGLSALHCVDISKSRNYVTVGLALFLPIFLPKWVVDNADKIQTGHHELDNTLVALFGNAIFIACFVGFILDNTLPGQRSTFGKSGQHLPTNDNSVYDLPFVRKRWFRHRWIKFVPFLPHYNYDTVVERTSGSPAITDV